MRSLKQSDSPSGYDREIRPRVVRDTIAHQEAGVRRLTTDLWWRRIQPLMPSEAPVLTEEFGGECTL